MRLKRYPAIYNTLNADQNLIFDMLIWGYENGKHFFFTGNAGSGKSYVINAFYQFCMLNNINLAQTASTGVAATNINGTTVHRMFKIPAQVITEDLLKDQYCNCSTVLRYIDICLVDEISMLRLDVFDNFMANIEQANEYRAMEGKKPIMIILVGDFSQLAPVIKPTDQALYNQLTGNDLGNGYCYHSHYWSEYKFIPLLLKQPMRQSDMTFYNALNEIRYGIDTSIDYINDNSSKAVIQNGIWLCGTNATAELKNNDCMKNLKNSHTNIAEKYGHVDMSQTTFIEDLTYAVKARIVMLINDPDNKYVNGSLGTITKIYTNTLKVEIQLDNGNLIQVEPFTQKFYEYVVEDEQLERREIGSLTQFPFKTAYAVTIHKSQGQTYDQMNLIPEIWAPGQLYVALSRCKTLENIHIQPVCGHKLITNYVKADPDVINFMNCMEKVFKRFTVFYSKQIHKYI